MGEMLNQKSWTNSLEFYFNSASIIKFITHAWLAAMIFNILVELIDGSLMPSVSMGTVSDTMVTRWFRDWMY